jgi:hypothetical protein
MGFSAGSYVNAYETEDLAEAFEYRDTGAWTEAYCHAFVLGFYASYELDEIPSDHRAEYESAYASVHGQRVLELGYHDPQKDLS